MFVASGHVRAGKTRLGLELGKLLQESAVYVQVELGNGYGYQANFDGLNKDNHRERLGGRLLRAYFETDELKAISSTTVLDMIFKLNPKKNSIVVHFDEHAQYVHEAAENLGVGSEQSKRLLTQFFDVLSAYERSQHRIVYPLVSGTTFDDVAVDHASHYATVALPLSPLNIDQSLELARDRMNKKNVDHSLVDSIMQENLFQVAIADTGGLPGVVIWAADGATHSKTFEQGDYIAELVRATSAYAKFPQDNRWKQIIYCSLARPPLKFNSVLVRHQSESNTSRGWTVKDASESGSVIVKQSTSDKDLQLRVASCFVAASSTEYALPLETSILFANLSKSDRWTWQRFEEAHAHYCAAVLNALYETRRFWSERGQHIRLKHVFRSAQPQCEVLDWVLEPQKDFQLTVHRDEKQSIPKSNSPNLAHSIDIYDKQRVHLAKAGTPIIDAHFNLSVKAFLNGDEKELTVFVQYKHTAQIDTSAKIKVSEMNAAVINLMDKLSSHGWPPSREWVFLWVTNRLVDLDVEPNDKLLWVGRNEVYEHAPLIGMRGLVTGEVRREGE